jgi:pyridoxal phosphate-dependent aminotransferase EpsN
MQYSIPLSYNPIDIPALTKVLSGYQAVHHNRMVEDFEKAITKLTGSHAVALNSGTSAIHLALKILGVGKNDIILAPTFTYIATVNPALYLGAKPVFVDSVSDTWNMNPEVLREAIQDAENQGIKPKAIVIVHTYGMPSDMDEICRIAGKHNIPIIEDAAESFGSSYKGKQTGTFGRVGIYSFNNNKTFTTYGGGVLLTADPKLAQKARFLASQGRENLPYYEYQESGFNYLMGPLNAAYGLSQLQTSNRNIEKRRNIVQEYQADLANREIEFQLEKPEMRSNRWFSTIVVKNKARRIELANALTAHGIETRPLWKPLHTQPLFRDARAYVTGVSDMLFERGLCLPSGNNLSPSDQRKVIDVIDRFR